MMRAGYCSGEWNHHVYHGTGIEFIKGLNAVSNLETGITIYDVFVMIIYLAQCLSLHDKTTCALL